MLLIGLLLLLLVLLLGLLVLLLMLMLLIMLLLLLLMLLVLLIVLMMLEFFATVWLGAKVIAGCLSFLLLCIWAWAFLSPAWRKDDE